MIKVTGHKNRKGQSRFVLFCVLAVHGGSFSINDLSVITGLSYACVNMHINAMQQTGSISVNGTNGGARQFCLTGNKTKDQPDA